MTADTTGTTHPLHDPFLLDLAFRVADDSESARASSSDSTVGSIDSTDAISAATTPVISNQTIDPATAATRGEHSYVNSAEGPCFVPIANVDSKLESKVQEAQDAAIDRNADAATDSIVYAEHLNLQTDHIAATAKLTQRSESPMPTPHPVSNVFDADYRGPIDSAPIALHYPQTAVVKDGDQPSQQQTRQDSLFRKNMGEHG